MIEEMIATRENELECTGWSNFAFVENEDGSVSVAVVHRLDVDRRWSAYVYELANSRRWYAVSRLLVCNLDTFESSDTLSLSELTKRVKQLETWQKRVMGIGE